VNAAQPGARRDREHAPSDPRKFAAPSQEFLLGTDNLGRDILSRLVYGARLSIGSAVAAELGISACGVGLGMVSGYFGGLIDAAISRLTDALLAFPTFLLALAITGMLGPSLEHLLLAIVLSWWAGYARIVRAAVLAEREKDYVEAARALGASDRRILFRHMLPGVLAPVTVLTTLELGALLLGVSGLSFLGLGVEPPAAEWGAMLAEGRSYLSQGWQMMLFPGLAIFLVVLGFNLLGDGLRDALDPRVGQTPS
jgi:peptide/nickel transport system permease protein